MKKLLIGMAVLGIFLAGCQRKEVPTPTPATQPAAQTTPSPAVNTAMVERVYEGVLPCAECDGIRTRIKISGKEGDATANMFELTETSLGREPENVFVMRGNYIIQRGMDGDSNATVYIFNPDKPKADQEYYAIYGNDPTTLYALDSDMKKIESDLNFALKLTS